MNLDELARALATIDVDQRVIALGGHADNCWCIEQASDGAWEVYWSERGGKHGLVRLDTESAACTQLFGRLAYTQLIAGVALFPDSQP